MFSVWEVRRWAADNGIGGATTLYGFYDSEHLADRAIDAEKATGTWDSFHKREHQVKTGEDHITVLDELREFM